MATVNNGMLILSLTLLSFIQNCWTNRQVTTSFINYGQDSVAHINATGHSDALHYLVTTIGLPTVFVAHTTKDAELDIDLEKFASGNRSEMAGSIKFKNSKDVLYSYAVVFTRLVEYNDTKDKADMTKYGIDDVSWNSYEFANFTWENMTEQSSAKHNMILFNATRTEEEIWNQNGSLTFKFSAFDHAGRETDLPHLQFNENITQFDFTIDHLTTNLSMSRFAIEAVMVSEGQTSMKIDETRSIDDEYSPGVFKINNWLSKAGNLADTGFLQWKPVCYQKSKRARACASGMKHYGIVPVDNHKEALLNNTILFGYYGNGLPGITRNTMNISYGIGDDGGYNKTQYLTWSASIGYGTPPEDKVSLLVIIVISAGLGIPVVIILFGGIYVCVKKQKSKAVKPLKSVQDGYQPIANGTADS